MQRGETWDARERTNPDELNAARARLLIANALGQLSAEHRALIGRCPDDVAECFYSVRCRSGYDGGPRCLQLADRCEVRLAGGIHGRQLCGHTAG